ncbi:MAG: alpha-galactosidase, partial [Clostridiales bacterium]|nr:alpha-galactosidase [Clostridiales bacterium]
WIQHGTSFGYPISSVGSHVSAIPNHQTGRKTHINTRGVVAMAGSFGYELDLSLLSEEEKEAVKEQISSYKKYWNLIHNGEYYRLFMPEEEREMAGWSFISEDKKEALVNIVSLTTHGNAPVTYIKCKGLDPTKQYTVEGTETVYDGSVLINVGIPVPVVQEEYHAWQYHLCEKFS